MKKNRALPIGFIVLIYYIGNGLTKGPHPPLVTRHFHPKPSKNVKLTEDTNVLRDIKHLQEDAENLSEQFDFDRMNDEELEFSYFRIHDTNNDNRLDGLEIYNAILHIVRPKEWNNYEKISQQTEDDIARMVDNVLNADDIDMDGYISYQEYIVSRRAERKKIIRKVDL